MTLKVDRDTPQVILFALKAIYEVFDETHNRTTAQPHKLSYLFVGLLLISTAISKLWILLIDPFADLFLGVSKELLWTAVTVELWLGYLNFRVHSRELVAVFNLFTFSAFGTFAASRSLLGYANCGCAGIVQIPIWIFVALDYSIAVYFAYFILRKSKSIVLDWWNGMTQAACGRYAGVAISIAAVLTLQLPAAQVFRTKIFGESLLYADVELSDQLYVGRAVIGEVSLHNRSALKSNIVGVEKSCTCVQLPVAEGISIPPLSNYKLSFTVSPLKSGRMHQRVVLFLDHPEQFRMNIDVVGYVQE